MPGDIWRWAARTAPSRQGAGVSGRNVAPAPAQQRRTNRRNVGAPWGRRLKRHPFIIEPTGADPAPVQISHSSPVKNPRPAPAEAMKNHETGPTAVAMRL